MSLGSPRAPGASLPKADDIAALKRAKRDLDRKLVDGAAEMVADLVRQLRGDRAVETITSGLCGHSRRPDCLGKQIAQAVAEALGLQEFADRPCAGSATRRSSPSFRHLSELPIHSRP